MFGDHIHLGMRPISNRRAPRRRFVPEKMTGESACLLEGRSLTAPALYRVPFGSIGDLDIASVSQTGSANSPTTVSADNSATNTLSNTTPSGGPSGSIGGTATTSIVDNNDPAPPAAAQGSYTTSIDESGTINWSGVFGGYIGGAFDLYAYRNYTIADDGTGPLTGWYVKETYSVSYSAPDSTKINPMFIASTLTLSTPTLAINTGGTNTIDHLTINGQSIPPTGSIMAGPNGSTISSSWTGNSVNVTAYTPLPALTVAEGNPVSGLAWPVTEETQMGMQGGTSNALALQFQVAANYGASFVQSVGG